MQTINTGSLAWATANALGYFYMVLCQFASSQLFLFLHWLAKRGLTSTVPCVSPPAQECLNRRHQTPSAQLAALPCPSKHMRKTFSCGCCQHKLLEQHKDEADQTNNFCLPPAVQSMLSCCYRWRPGVAIHSSSTCCPYTAWAASFWAG